MPWQTRLREGAYTSPGGTRITFKYQDFSRSFELRNTPFTFAGVNGSYIQQNGFNAGQYPLRCTFSGPEHDRVAAAFEAGLLEHGIGRLEHPLYTTIDVVPVGTITRHEDPTRAANQSVVEVTFSTTIAELYPSTQVDAQSEVLAAIEGFDVVAAQAFASKTNLQKIPDRAAMKGGVKGLLNGIQKSLGSVADSVSVISRQFHAIEDTINLGLDTFIGAPLQLAQQISNLIKSPARAFTALQERLAAYGVLAEEIFGSSAGNPGEALATSLGLALNTVKAANAFHLADLAAMSSLAALITAAVAEPIADPVPRGTSGNGARGGARSKNPALDIPGVGARIATRPQAINAATTIATRWRELVAWRDAGFQALASVPIGANRQDPIGNARADTGEALQALQKAVSLATGYLIQISFSKLPERAIVLGRERTIVDLCAELYPRVPVDSKLDFLLITNDLTGDEIVTLPAGRRIVYYPEAA